MQALDWAMVAAIASAVAGIGAWWAARRSAGSSERAAEAAAKVTAIESERTHRDLIPEFTFRLVEGHQGVDDSGVLTVELIGPPGLDFLDEVTIKILDETGQDHWGDRIPDRLAAEARGSFGPRILTSVLSLSVGDDLLI